MLRLRHLKLLLLSCVLPPAADALTASLQPIEDPNIFAGLGADLVWDDPVFGEVDSSLRDVSRLLTGNWYVLVGDSTMRMLYDMLVGHLQFGWNEWPAESSHHNKSMDARHACDQALPDSRKSSVMCIQHARHAATNTWLTHVWVDYYDVDQLAPLENFIRDVAFGVPDGVAVGFGAWFKRRRPGDADIASFATRLDTVLSRLDAMFAAPVPSRVALGLPGCGDGDVLDERVNGLIRNASLAHEGWKFYDRTAILAKKDDVTAIWHMAMDCYIGEFHPAGQTLNVQAKLLLLHLNATGASRK